MNKAQLLDELTGRLGSKRVATSALDHVVDSITRAVAKGERVAITGFGAFEKVNRPARTARNPATGASVKVKKTSVPKFKAGQAFKAVVNGQKKPSTVPTLAATSAGSSGGTAKKASSAGRSTAKKTGAKKSTAKRGTAKKSTAKRGTAKKSTAKRGTAKKSSPAKRTTKSAAAKRTTAKRTTTKRATAKKSTARKSTARKSPARKSTARRTAKKS